jgi:stage II sporulation protein AA (anti-sigma F factor antagonist)
MEVKIENRPEGLYVRLCGEIDHHSARKIREQVDSAIEMFRPAKLCLDFKDVTFMDSYYGAVQDNSALSGEP